MEDIRSHEHFDSRVRVSRQCRGNKGGLYHVDPDRQRLLFLAYRVRGALGRDEKTSEGLAGFTPWMKALPDRAATLPTPRLSLCGGVSTGVHGG